MNHIKKAAIFDPPGGILIWILIFLELVTFSIGVLFFIASGKTEPQPFRESRVRLDMTIGVCNTAILLTSGFFMAEALRLFKTGDRVLTGRMIVWAGVLGLAFLMLKTVEYQAKIQAGFSLEYNTFFTFYWLMTGFHFIHVIVGVIILTALFRINRRPINDTSFEYFEAGAAYWHMCDLIWLIIFPALYLFF